MMELLPNSYREILDDDFEEVSSATETIFSKVFGDMISQMNDYNYVYRPSEKQTKQVVSHLLKNDDVRNSFEELYNKSEDITNTYSIMYTVICNSIGEVKSVYAGANNQNHLKQRIINSDENGELSMKKYIERNISKDLVELMENSANNTLNLDYFRN